MNEGQSLNLTCYLIFRLYTLINRGPVRQIFKPADRFEPSQGKGPGFISRVVRNPRAKALGLGLGIGVPPYRIV